MTGPDYRQQQENEEQQLWEELRARELADAADVMAEWGNEHAE